MPRQNHRHDSLREHPAYLRKAAAQGRRSRIGTPPRGGGSSSPSSRRSAARMSASRMVWPMPGISRSAGQDSTANMSDAQDDRMIRFSGAESSLSFRTSSGDA